MTDRLGLALGAALLLLPFIASSGRGEEIPAASASEPAADARSEAEESLPRLEHAAVTLPWNEVRRLIDAASIERSRSDAARELKERPPAAELLGSAEYRATVGRASTRIEARFEIEFLVDGWHRIRVLGSGPSIEAATLDGAPAKLLLDEEWYSLVAKGKGRRVLALRFVLPRGTEAGDGHLDLSVAGFPSNRLELTIPRPAIAVTVEPSGSLLHEERQGTTRVVAAIPQTNQLRIAWSGALPAAEIAETKVLRRCAVSQLVSVGGGLVRLDARLTFSVLQGRTERFDFRLPPDTTLLDVSGEAVREHRVVRHREGSAVAVSLSQPMSGSFVVRVQAERALDPVSPTVEVPELTILDVDREWGHVGVNATTNIEIRPVATDGLTAIDVKELPAEVWQAAQHPVLLSFKYQAHPYRLQLEVRRHEDLPVLASTIDTAWVTTFQTADGKLLHSALMQTKNTRQQFMKIRLPAGARILAAFVSDLPVKPATNEAGEVLVPLEKSATGDADQRPFPVEILYFEEEAAMGWFGRSDRRAFEVDIPISVFRWTLYLPRQFAYWGFSGSLERGTGWEPTARGSGSVAKQAIERLEAQGRGAAGSPTGEVGLLPVRINLPTSGARHAFQTELVMVGEKPPSLAFRFVAAGFRTVARGLLALAAALLAVRAGFLLVAARRGDDIEAPLVRATRLIALLIGFVGVDTWLFGPSVPTIAATLVALIVGIDTHVQVRSASRPVTAEPLPE